MLNYSGGDFFCCNNLACTGGIRLGVFAVCGSFSFLAEADDGDFEAFEDFLNVFLSGLANCSAVKFSSPLLLPVDEDIESEAFPLTLGLGFGFRPNGVEVEEGKSKTKSGVCLAFCWMATRWFQKSRLERKPPRRLPMSLSVIFPPAPEVGDFFSQMFRVELNPLESAEVLTCSRDDQLDVLSMTGLLVMSEAEVEPTDGLGAGSGGLLSAAKETRSRGRAPLADGKVWLLMFSEVLRRIMGFGRSFASVEAKVEDVDLAKDGFFCFSKCSAMASTSFNVESSCVFSSWLLPVEARLSCEVESRASMDGFTGNRLRGA